MDRFQARLKDSLQLRLGLWLSAAIVALALCASALAYWGALKEAYELQDDTLRQVAALVTAQRALAPALASHARNADPESSLIVQRLSDTSSRPGGEGLPLPPTLEDGAQTVRVPGASYRVFVTTLADRSRVAVGQQTALRDEVARGAAGRALLPMLLVPMLVLFVAHLLRKMLRPIAQLSRDVEARSQHELHALTTDSVPSEIRPFIIAINRLLARVEQSMTLQRRFTADAAHELRTPMAALSLQAERLAAAEMSDEARERLQRLRQGIRRGRHLLDQLLGLASAYGSAVAACTPVSLQTVCRRVLEDLLPLAEAKGIDLGMAAGNDASVMATQDELAAVVRNLLDNAIRYAPQDGRVDVRVASDGAEALFQVEDNGPGIPSHERARVLDPFYRVLGTGEHGSGLGLSIVSMVVQRLGGRIEMDDSPTHGHGLRITVFWPRGPTPASRPGP